MRAQVGSSQRVVCRSTGQLKAFKGRICYHPAGSPSSQGLQLWGVARQQRSSVQCRSLFGLGLPELAVIAGIAALVFGPSKLPELGRGLGKTLKSFQSAAKEFEQELKDATKDDGQGGKAPSGQDPAKKE